MTAANLVESVVRKVTGAPVLPEVKSDFKGSPLHFKQQAVLYRAETGMQSGWPNILRATDGGATHNESVIAMSFTGLLIGANGKKVTPANEVWLVCRINPHRPGPEGPTSVLSWHVAKGVVTPEIVQQATGFLAQLSAHGYLSPAKK